MEIVVQANVRAAHALVSAPRTLPPSTIPADERVDGEALLMTIDERIPFEAVFRLWVPRRALRRYRKMFVSSSNGAHHCCFDGTGDLDLVHGKTGFDGDIR